MLGTLFVFLAPSQGTNRIRESVPHIGEPTGEVVFRFQVPVVFSNSKKF